MNTNVPPERSGTASLASATISRGDVSRRIGDIRAVTLESKAPNADHIFGGAKAILESLDETFGESAHGALLERDRKMYSSHGF